jgi:hypothetical protein
MRVQLCVCVMYVCECVVCMALERCGAHAAHGVAPRPFMLGRVC